MVYAASVHVHAYTGQQQHRCNNIDVVVLGYRRYRWHEQNPLSLSNKDTSLFVFSNTALSLKP